MEMQFFRPPSLAMVQAGVLLGVPEKELYLEPCPVIFQYLGGRERKVGGEIELVRPFPLFQGPYHHQVDVPFMCLVPDGAVESLPPGLPYRTGEVSPVQVVVAYLPGIFFRPSLASPCLLYTSDAADDLLCVDLGGRR